MEINLDEVCKLLGEKDVIIYQLNQEVLRQQEQIKRLAVLAAPVTCHADQS